MIYKLFILTCISFTTAVILPREYLSLRTYHNFKNSIIKYEFSFSSDGLSPDEILSITWPYALHNVNKNEIKISIL